MTPYQRHKKQWSNCKGCLLYKHRKRVVLARGKIPAEILFIGEAPGASEDVLGRPFVGPAGKLLDRIIDRAIDGQHDYALTNLVACIPKEDGKKAGEPPEEAIEACASRLLEFSKICDPLVTICVGRLAAKWVPGILTEENITEVFVEIIHPAAILRMDVSQQGLAVQRAIVTIEDAVVDL